MKPPCHPEWLCSIFTSKNLRRKLANASLQTYHPESLWLGAAEKFVKEMLSQNLTRRKPSMFPSDRWYEMWCYILELDFHFGKQEAVSHVQTTLSSLTDFLILTLVLMFYYYFLNCVLFVIYISQPQILSYM